MLIAGTDLALIGAFGQGKGAAERSVAALPYVVAAALRFLLGLALPRDGQYVLMQRNIDVLWLNAWQLGSNDQVSVLLRCVYRRRPLGNALKLASRAAAKVAKHLVE